MNNEINLKYCVKSTGEFWVHSGALAGFRLWKWMNFRTGKFWTVNCVFANNVRYSCSEKTELNIYGIPKSIEGSVTDMCICISKLM